MNPSENKTKTLNKTFGVSVLNETAPRWSGGTPTSRHLQGAGEPITYKCAAPLIYRRRKNLSVRVV